MTTAAVAPPVSGLHAGPIGTGPRSAPIGRLLAAETRWVLRRPRTLVLLGVFALMPVLMAVGIAVADGVGPGRGLIGAVAGNGLVLPIAALTLALALLLPLAVSMAAADAIAGESASGTLRGLLLAPVSRLRLVAVKAYGVLLVATLAVLLVAVVGVVSGLVVVGGPGVEMITLSGTTIGFGEAVGRVALVAVWTVWQLVAIGLIALAVSAFTDHPLVVLATMLGGLIVFGVLTAIPALDWLQPYLLTTGWTAPADALRDPITWDRFTESSLRALCYAAIGAGLTTWRMLRRDA